MTNLYLLSVPFESNYKDTVYFAEPAEQENYMTDKRVEGLAFENFSYQRKDNIIRVPAHIDTLYKANYVAYQNKSVTNDKWFYAFIVDMKYVNEERTDITIQTDVIQTWMFDYTVKPSFVEREHTDNDSFGLHTLPEQLETGEYKCVGYFHKEELSKCGIVIASTVDISEHLFPIFDTYTKVGGNTYNGLFCGLHYYYFNNDEDARNALLRVDGTAQAEAIQAVFVCPDALLDYDFIAGHLNHYSVGIIKPSKEPKVIQWQHEDTSDLKPWMPHTIDGYTVRNNKLLTYPYNYLLGTNNAGASNVYRYEFFANGDPDFEITATITPGMSGKLIPKNYCGLASNYNEALTLAKYPICSWASDVFINWLTQQSVNIAIDNFEVFNQIASSGVNFGIGLLSQDIGQMASGAQGATQGITSSMRVMAEIYRHSLIPPATKGNINSGDVNFSMGMCIPSLYQMCIRKEYAEIIDEFFDMYGYKVNRVKIPNFDHRPYYWFTKTIDVNIDGAIPNTDLEKIKQCYNNGITFWRPSAKMGVYHSTEQDNSLPKG